MTHGRSYTATGASAGLCPRVTVALWMPCVLWVSGVLKPVDELFGRLRKDAVLVWQSLVEIGIFGMPDSAGRRCAM